jgi:hypothetical protein
MLCELPSLIRLFDIWMLVKKSRQINKVARHEGEGEGVNSATARERSIWVDAFALLNVQRHTQLR